MSPNLSKVAPLMIAVLCITAIGVSATTLETSLSTDPDEEIDPAYERLPIGQEDAVVIYEEMGDAGSEDEQGSDGDEERDSEGASSAPSGSGDPGDQEVSASEESQGLGAGQTGLIDWLLSILFSVLRFLLTLAVIVGVAAVAYRYRERIADALWGALQPDDDPVDVEYSSREWPDGSPSNAVERAWLTLVREVDPERPSVMTPAECAAAARDADVDESAAETITDAFERVEYGGVSPDDERDRVEEALQRLRRGSGVTKAEPRRRRGAGGGGR